MPTLDRTRSCNAIRSLTATLDDDLLLETLPVGMYACDANGMIVRYNPAAAALWGREPRLGETDERFCGSYRLLDLDGKHIPSAECPMATALATGRSYRDERIQIERPDGSRIVALVNIEVLKNAHGQVMGAVKRIPRQRMPRPRTSTNRLCGRCGGHPAISSGSALHNRSRRPDHIL